MKRTRLSSYVDHGNQLVKGWLMPGAIQAVVGLSTEQRRASVPGGVAEIGVHHGRLFILLYLLTNGGSGGAVAIDLFSRQDLNSDHSGAGDLDRFRKNLIRHADTERLVVFEGNSMDLNSQQLIELGGGPLRMISIDGGHSAEVTAHDLSVSEGALANGGMIILDDCFNEAWPGVIEGVHKYFSSARAIVPFGIGANKTFFCHRSFAERYAAVLNSLDHSARPHEFLGSNVVCFTFRPKSIGAWLRRVDAFRLFRRLYHDAMSR